MTTKAEYEEPKGEEFGGYQRYRLPLSPYERFLKEEEVPIFRGIGVYDVRQLSLGPWKRLGGRGIFLQLDGCGPIRGMYVVEVPAAGALNSERHFYDEFMYVVEGRGSTEIWREGSTKRQTFEWQAGSLFNIPTNTHHRLVNASTSPALVLAATNAPPIMNIFQSRNAIFDNPYEFRERYDESVDFFKARSEVELEPVRGRAMVSSNVYHDIANCGLPRDNQRMTGSRRIQPHFTGYDYGPGAGGFIHDFSVGRYTVAHYHAAGAVLVCLKGKGYSFNWPVPLGTRPWEAGKGDQVKLQEYTAGGLVAAAPGGGNWYHQHFGLSKPNETFRVMNFWCGPTPIGAGTVNDEEGGPGREVEAFGRAIQYKDEDPFIRKEYEAALKREGLKSTMPDSLWSAPDRIFR
ncbi:cupin domain-containing protein [Chloroflexota bacterium]